MSLRAILPRSSAIPIITCLLILSGCGAPPLPGGTRPVIKIGLTAPFEGLKRPLGYEALLGTKLALAERNAAGGVGGYMVELVALNDFGEADEARWQARELAADPAVMGVVTGWTGETARASLPVYRQEGMAVAVAWSVPAELADQKAGMALVAADVQQVAGVLARAVAADHPQRLVVVGDEPTVTPYFESLSALGLKVQMVSPPNAGDGLQTWAAHLTQSRMQPPDALFLTTDGDLAGESLLALAALDWTGATFGSVDTGSVHLVDVAGDVADGLVFASPAPTGRDLMAGYDTLGPRAVLGYDATQVLLDALELAVRQDGRPTRPGVATALPTVRRHGLTGPIAFDAAGRRVEAPVWLYTIVDRDYPGQMFLTP